MSERSVCRFQYQVQRCDKSNARTSFGDLKSKLFLGADSSIKRKSMAREMMIEEYGGVMLFQMSLAGQEPDVPDLFLLNIFLCKEFFKDILSKSPIEQINIRIIFNQQELVKIQFP